MWLNFLELYFKFKIFFRIFLAYWLLESNIAIWADKQTKILNTFQLCWKSLKKNALKATHTLIFESPILKKIDLNSFHYVYFCFGIFNEIKKLLLLKLLLNYIIIVRENSEKKLVNKREKKVGFYPKSAPWSPSW